MRCEYERAFNPEGIAGLSRLQPDRMSQVMSNAHIDSTLDHNHVSQEHQKDKLVELGHHSLSLTK